LREGAEALEKALTTNNIDNKKGELDINTSK